MAEIKQYVDMDGLRKLLTLIRDTYVCQNGLTSEIRKQIQDAILDIKVVVKQCKSDDTDPTIIANSLFPDYTAWKNGDLLIVENTAGHNSVFYWFNSTWICISKAPVNEIKLTDTPEYLKNLIPTAAAVIKVIDEKLADYTPNTGGGSGGTVSVDIATTEKAGIVKGSNEENYIFVDTDGRMKLNNVSIAKVTNLETKLAEKMSKSEVAQLIKNETYTKDEVNALIDNVSVGGANLSNYYTKEEINQLLILNSNKVIQSEGTVTNKEELPSEASTGTVYSVIDDETGDETQFCYNGSEWIQVAEEASTDTWETW